jgi:uncharacterized protein
MPYLAHLYVYPIKSLDGVAVDQARVLSSGALEHDREFAIVGQDGKFVNGKRTAKVHLVRSSFDLPNRLVTLGLESSDYQETFHLEGDRSKLESWLSDYFEMSVQLIQNTEVGFPDDLASPGPTLVSTATLVTIATWFPNTTLAEVRQRFRSNLEIDDAPASWEDQLFSDSGEPVPFTVGAVSFLGINPYQRCVVITRHPQTGEPYPNFQKTFIAERKASLPQEVAVSRFNHFFRLAVNTRLAVDRPENVIQVGDAVVRSG